MAVFRGLKTTGKRLCYSVRDETSFCPAESLSWFGTDAPKVMQICLIVVTTSYSVISAKTYMQGHLSLNC